MSARNYQASFASGVLAPSLFSRIDLARYPLGAETILNAFVQKQGGVCNRPGFEYVGNIAGASGTVRLIEFEFNTTQTYALEFGAEYMRVVKDGGHVTETAVTITGASQTNPVVITTSGAHGYTTGDEVFISGITGMTELNNRRFLITSTGASTFSLQDFDAANVDGTGYTAYSSGGESARIYTLTTPYLAPDLFDLKYTQSQDTITITHPDYAPRELTRTDHDAWTLTTIGFGNGGVSYPTGIDETPSNFHTTTRDKFFVFKVTAVDGSGNESLPGTSNDTFTITNVTQADPGVFTISSSDAVAPGDEFIISGVVGMTELNGQRLRVREILSSTTFSMETPLGVAVDTSGYTAYSSAGTLTCCFLRVEFQKDRETYAGTIEWTPVDGAEYYRVYTSVGDGFGTPPSAATPIGFLGDTDSASFTDPNIQTDNTDTPPRAISIFDSATEYPSTVTYFEQRRAFANSIDNPQTFWFSQTGRHANFNKSRPLRDDDALEFTIQHNQVNEIRHMVANQGQLILFTSGAEWLANSGENPISASNIPKLEPQSTNGCSKIRPLVVNDTILYVDSSERMIRDLAYSFERDARGGSDLSVMAENLFEGRTIVDWCYSKRPHSILWIVMSDGDLVGLTYLPEHDIMAFHEHETTGSFKSVCTVREGNEDVLYAVVTRTINGNSRTFIERLHERDFTSVSEAFFVDCGSTYSGGATTTITGLWHLEGETVVGLADGEPFSGKTITGGTLTLDESASTVHVGLSYTCDLQTLPIGAVELQGRYHKIDNAFVRVKDTRGLQGGWAEDTGTLDALVDPYEATADPQPLQTKTYKVPVQSDWRRTSGLLLRSTTPLPWTVLGVTLDVATGR